MCSVINYEKLQHQNTQLLQPKNNMNDIPALSHAQKFEVPKEFNDHFSDTNPVYTTQIEFRFLAKRPMTC